MRNPVLAFLLAGLLTLGAAATAQEAPGKPVPVFASLKANPGTTATRTTEGWRVSSTLAAGEGRLYTDQKHPVPLVITAQAKTDSNNIRLYYGEKGLIILNWEVNGTELRHNAPATGQPTGVPGKGQVPKNTWVTVKWTIEERLSRIEVDGVERGRFEGNYAGLSEQVGVGTLMANATFRSLTVTPLRPAPKAIVADAPRLEVEEGATSIMGKLTGNNNLSVTKTDDGLQFTTVNRGLHGLLYTKEEFKGPLVITAQARTESNNIRLFYGKGMIILNWEFDNKQLKYGDPWTSNFSIIGDGTIPRNTWVTVRWTLDKDGSVVEVNGVERGRVKGNFEGFSGPIGIGTHLATAVFREVTVRPLLPGGQKPPSRIFEVAVPTRTPAAGAKVEQGAPPPEFAGIERTEFQENPKRLMKGLTGVTGMSVMVGEDGQQSGFTSDIIATVPAESRTGDVAGVRFVRSDGDSTMRTALDEAVRAVRLRYPFWEPGRIDISFGEKFVAHGGPSAGTAFAMMMLSALEGWEIDRKCAFTGDITVDWKVRKVGGVTAKVRGAALDKCLYAAIPVDNETAFTDMGVLYGTSALYDIQVFSIATLQDAAALARTDRPAKLAEAIKLFADLQPQLAKAEKPTLAKAETKQTLKKILELAPNHLSAKRLLAVAENTAPKTLSVNGTSYQLSVIFYPYHAMVDREKELTRSSLPPHMTATARRRINTLRPIAHRDYLPLLADTSAFVEAMDGFVSGRVSLKTLRDRAQSLDAKFAALGSDPEFLGKVVREGY